MRRGTILFAFCLLIFSLASAQQTASSSQQVIKPIPLPHLYWHLLMWQNHLDSTAAAREKNGQDGTWLRTYIQKRLNFTDEQFAPVRASAQHLGASIASLDAQAKPLIQEDQALYAQGVRTPPPNLAQLKSLTQARETAIADEISQLNAALGLQNSARLQEFVQKYFSASVKAVSIQPVLHPPTQIGTASAHGVQP